MVFWNSSLDSVMPVKTGIRVTDSVRHTVEERYPDYEGGMDPAFHRGDDDVDR
jgi:hypothetical protein